MSDDNEHPNVVFTEMGALYHRFYQLAARWIVETYGEGPYVPAVEAFPHWYALESRVLPVAFVFDYYQGKASSAQYAQLIQQTVHVVSQMVPPGTNIFGQPKVFTTDFPS